MAKARIQEKPATRAADKKTSAKPAAGKSVAPAKEAAPAKAAKPAATSKPKSVAPPSTPAPAPAKAAPAKAETSKAEAAPRTKAAAAAASKPIPDASQARAHADAKLTKAEVQLLHGKLVEERSRMLATFDRHLSGALEDEDMLADEIDIAQRASEQASLFRMADKDRKLLIEIESALEKMKNGEYGLCEGTDEPIGFKRLELRPWTRYSVSYKELLEHEKAQHSR